MNKLFAIIKYLEKKDLLAVVFIILIVLALSLFNGSKKTDNPLSGQLQEKENSLASSPQISNNFYLIPQSADQFYPFRDWSVVMPNISAKAAIVTTGNGNKILFANNIQTRRPIASLTKLCTALVVADNLNFDDKVIISKKAIEQDGNEGSFVIGEKVKIKDLVASMLIASSNDAAYALAEFLSSQKENNLATSTIDLEPFIDLMNKKASELGLHDTHFSSVTGLEDDGNYSTAYDISLLIDAVYKNPKINVYADKPRYSFESDEPVIKHNISNTNKLFDVLQGILLSKTGYTDGAGQSLGMIYQLSNGQKISIVVLGSDDRFKDARTLIDWTQKAYRF
jgi:D-alanyl-D-alanine carboxypeptidase